MDTKKKRRVVITGLGTVNPTGNTVAESWAAVKAGRCAVGPITAFDTTDFKVKLAAEVKDFDPAERIDRREARKMARFTQFAVAAADEAIHDSGIALENIDHTRFGVILSSGIGGLPTIEEEHTRGQQRGFEKVSPYFVPMSIGNMAAGQVAIRFGLQGMCSCPTTACAGGTNAIGDAFHRIRDGYEDRMLCGGSESCISPLGVGGFASMKALCTADDPARASIPFDARRSGFVMGEGSGVLLLEELETAKERGAKIYAEVVGYGANCDAYHFTAPAPGGAGGAACMRLALADGGVVPELASRAHQQNIVPVVHEALKRAGVTKEELSAVAFTRGPGLMGSLLVGVSFAKGFARSLGIPMIDVNHLTGHVLAHFIKAEGEDNVQPEFPFLCLLVSGGNSQIILVKAYNDMEILGQTIDDAAGEAIDKCSKVMGLGYPGGPIIDKLARQGNPKAFSFSKPHIPGLDYSFSGLKTSFLYSLRDWMKDDPDFIEHHKTDLAASLEATVVDILMDKLRKAAKQYKIKEVAVAGGVSANNGLRNAFREHAGKYGWKIFIPKFSYTTDNAAMIAITGYFKYMDKDFCPMEAPAYSRVTLG